MQPLFSHTVDGCRLNRPDLLHILKDHHKFFECLLKYTEGGSTLRTYVEDARAVWAAYHPLASLSMQAHTRITADEWKKLAIPFLEVRRRTICAAALWLCMWVTKLTVSLW